MRMLSLLFLLGAIGCESARPRLDPDREDAGSDAALIDGGSMDGSAPDARPDPFDMRPDQASADVGLSDASLPDLSIDATPTPDARIDAAPVDGAVDAEADGAVDADVDDAGLEDAGTDGPEDASAMDAGPDGALMDASPVDGAIDAFEPDFAEPPTGFITGVAQAADGRTVVEVRAGDVVTQTNAAGGFRLGPLPVGPAELRFSAARHEVRTRAVEVEADAEIPLETPVLLYRGRRIAPTPGAQLRFTSDGQWLIWSEDDALWRRSTVEGAAEGAAALALLPRGFEVFLGSVPGRPAVAVRRRAQAGLAGNIEVIDLADAARQPLFAEAQPWVRWRGETALGMVSTRDGLSELQLGAPGEAARTLAEGVPWLLVTTLADGEPAWAQADGDDFTIWRGGDALPIEPLAPALPATNAFLSTTPGRTGLLWLGPGGELVRWEPDQPARVLADAVLPTPRPRFLSGGRLLFWREAVDEPGLERLFLLSPAGVERPIIDVVDGNSLRLAGERYYIARPDDGLYTGRFDAPGAPVRLLVGDRVQYATQGPGVIALVDGAAWTAIPDGPAQPLNVAGLSSLQALNVGATAWQADGGSLWWLPGPDMAAPAAALVDGAPRARRVVERGNAAIYPLGAEGYLRVPIPPGAPTPFDEVTTELTSVSADLALAWSPEDWLYGVAPATGTTTGWAPTVTRLVLAGNRRLVAYVCDRGTYLVELE